MNQSDRDHSTPTCGQCADAGHAIGLLPPGAGVFCPVSQRIMLREQGCGYDTDALRGYWSEALVRLQTLDRLLRVRNMQPHAPVCGAAREVGSDAIRR